MRLARGLVVLMCCGVLAGCALRPVRTCVDHLLACGGVVAAAAAGAVILTDAAP